MKYGRLTILETSMVWYPQMKQNRTKARCRCDCGRLHGAWMDDLKAGNTKSCGCWKAESSSVRMKLWHQKRRESGRAWPPARKKALPDLSPVPGTEGRLGHFRAVSAADLIERMKKAKTRAY
jgi:hypothetical protein